MGARRVRLEKDERSMQSQILGYNRDKKAPNPTKINETWAQIGKQCSN